MCVHQAALVFPGHSTMMWGLAGEDLCCYRHSDDCWHYYTHTTALPLLPAYLPKPPFLMCRGPVSAHAMGGPGGALLAGYLADRCGRRGALLIDAGIYLVGTS